MLVRDAMRTGCGWSATPATRLADVITVMEARGVAPLPICDPSTGCVVGVVTECMVATVAFSKDLGAAVVDPETRVRDVMTAVGPGHAATFGAAAYVFDDQQIAEAERVLAQLPNLFRVPVLDREWRLVGSLSLDDIALSGDDEASLSAPRRP